MIKKLFTYLALILGLTACSDEIFDGPRDTIPENGEIPISFVVPEMTEGTRADQITDAANFLPDAMGSTVTMLVFDDSGDNGKLVDKKDFSSPTGTVTYEVPKAQRKNSKLFFLFFTNDNQSPNSNRNAASFALNTTLTNVLKQTASSVKSSDGNHLVMSGAASIKDLLQMNPILLYRNAARVSVENHAENTEATGILDFPFQVYGPRDGGLLFAGGYGKHDKITLGTSRTLDADFSLENEVIADNQNLKKYVYVQPTYNKNNTNEKKSYVIIKAKYQDKWYYYCLNFQNEDEDVMDILPNHYYKFQIKTKNMRAGYATPEEARKNPVALSSGMYLVVDYAPSVMNIVSDGKRTLGVNHTLTRDNSDTGFEYLFVKLASNGTAEEKAADYADFENNYPEYIKFSSDWVSLIDPATGEPAPLETPTAAETGTLGSAVYGTTGYDTTGDQIGKLYKVKVFFTGIVTGELETKATVSWKGLSRDVTVEWHRVFNAAQLYEKVETTMKGGGYGDSGVDFHTTTADYFKVLAGVKNDQGEYTSDGKPNVWGAAAEDNGGEARDQGLHFPMPYGDANPLKAQYIHKVTLQDLGDNNKYSWDYEIVGDPAITKYVKVTDANNNQELKWDGISGKPKFTISNSKEDSNGNYNSYEYGVGKLIIKVTQGTTTTPYEIPLYHTGFFHEDNTSNLAVTIPGETRKWTYYEVVEMEDLYWLDRNIGAHSANMYLQNSSGGTYAGDPAAAGGYYRVADYQKGKEPKMREGICPPGYDYPSKDEYDKLRKSANFSTATVGSYNDASYTPNTTYNSYQKNRDADDAEAKRKTVYFPKARYLNGTTGYGESRSGYYWTKTKSTGVEKDEVGAWLQCFMLSGSNASFINGEVYCSVTSMTGNETRKPIDDNPIPGYAMSLRCVAKNEGRVESDINRTSFYVTGATHVFLYTVVDGEKVGTTTWPGHAICSYNGIKNTYNFSYESRTTSADQLYAIFNYKDEDGKIHTLSRNVSLSNQENQIAFDSDKKIKYTDDKGMKELVGFKLTNGVAPNYDNYPNATVKTYVNDAPSKKYAYWNFKLAFDDNGKFKEADSQCGLSSTKGEGGVVVEEKDTHVLICWPNDWKNDNQVLDRIYMWSGSNKPFGEWNNGSQGVGVQYDNKYWVWAPKSYFTADMDTYQFQLYNSNNKQCKQTSFTSSYYSIEDDVSGLNSTLKNKLNSEGVVVTKYYEITKAEWW